MKKNNEAQNCDQVKSHYEKTAANRNSGLQTTSCRSGR